MSTKSDAGLAKISLDNDFTLSLSLLANIQSSLTLTFAQVTSKSIQVIVSIEDIFV